MKIKTYSQVFDGKKLYYRFEANGKTLVYTRNTPHIGDIVDLDGRGYYLVLDIGKDKAMRHVNVLTLELHIDSLELIKK